MAGAIRCGGINIGTIAEPVKIIEDADFEFLARANSIVILYPQKDASTKIRCLSPHECRIEDVAEVQPAGWRRRETRKQGFC